MTLVFSRRGLSLPPQLLTMRNFLAIFFANALTVWPPRGFDLSTHISWRPAASFWLPLALHVQLAQGSWVQPTTPSRIDHLVSHHGLAIMFSRHLGWLLDQVVSPLPSVREMLTRLDSVRLLEQGCGDGTALLEATAMAEETNQGAHVCAVGLTSLQYNLGAMGCSQVCTAAYCSNRLECGERSFWNNTYVREVYPQLAVAAGNTSRGALEAVARRGNVTMPASTPHIVDGDFSLGLQFPADTFNLVYSQTAVSKMDLHAVGDVK